MKNSKVKALALAAIMTTAPMGTLVQAQNAAQPAPQKTIKPGKPDIVVNCCKCIGEGTEGVNISTGKASWTVSKAPTAAASFVPGGAVGFVPTNPNPQVVPGNIGANPAPNVWTNATGADWLQPTAAGSTPLWNGVASSYANGHWTYVLKIQVPNCTIPQKVTISGSIASDDAARVYLQSGLTNSPVIQDLVKATPAHFSTASIQNFNAVLNPIPGTGFTKPGIYFLRVEVDNLGGGPTGMALNGKLSGECSRDLIKAPPKTKAEAAAAEPTEAVCADC